MVPSDELTPSWMRFVMNARLQTDYNFVCLIRETIFYIRRVFVVRLFMMILHLSSFLFLHFYNSSVHIFYSYYFYFLYYFILFLLLVLFVFFLFVHFLYS